MKNNKAFTLIELMIVVVIIGIIAAIVIPAFLGFLEKSNHKKELSSINRVRSVKAETELPSKTVFPSVVPETESADIKIHLAASHYVKGFKVYTLFNADFKGRYVFRNKHHTENQIKLLFPFPEGTTQVRNISLKILNPSGKLNEADDSVYELKGIEWYGTLNTNDFLTVEVTYSAQGDERYIYEGPGSSRAKSLTIDMKLDGVTSEFIPAMALQPSKSEPGHLVWEFKNLLTERRIIVELPGAMSAMGRVILFLRLAGFAVFLFGIGFMYLNDLEQPGRLDHFRWGHFLLLALNYSLLFIIFTALMLGGELNIYLSLVLSAILSIPLLLMHVARFWGKAFALKNILPLTVFTLSIVINGVFGGQIRVFIFIGLTVIMVAFFTLTYNSWLKKRRDYRDEKEQQHEIKYQKDREKEQSRLRANEQAEQRKSFESRRTKLIENLNNWWDEAARLVNKAKILLAHEGTQTPPEINQFVEKYIEGIQSLHENYNQIRIKIENILSIVDDATFLLEFMRIEENAKQFLTELEYFIQLLDQSIKDLAHFKERTKSQAEKDKKINYCMVCGAANQLSRYCSNCGTLNPMKLECKKCGEVYMLPIHLLDWEKSGQTIHCIGCGEIHTDKVGF